MYPYIEILTHTHTHTHRYTKSMATRTHTQTHYPLLPRTQGNGWDGPSTQSHSKPIKPDDSSDIYTIHPLLLSLSPAHAHTHTHKHAAKKTKNAFRWSPSSLPHHSHRQGKKIKREEGHLDRKARRMERMCVLRTVWILLVGSHMVYWWGDDTLRVNLWNKNLKDESGENEPILKRCWLTDGT